jgi:DNA-binding transcriptional LysR family regulator
MDWRSINFDWNRARAFLVTAEEGSFSAAARGLSSTQPTVGRQVAALEQDLGVTLFERVGTRLELTVSGLELLEHVRAMGAAANRTSLAATGQSESIEGVVCITASEAIMAFLLPPILQSLRLEHPGICLELIASNEVQDLQRREADIAIRNFAPKKPDLIARKVGERFAHFYASSDYVERQGPFDSMEHLAAAELFGFEHPKEMVEMFQKFLSLDCREDQFPIFTSSHLIQWAMCKQGAGICMMMEEVGDREPRVVRVFRELPSVPVPIWMVCHRELRTSRRLRLVFDWLAEGLAAS